MKPETVHGVLVAAVFVLCGCPAKVTVKPPADVVTEIAVPDHVADEIAVKDILRSDGPRLEVDVVELADKVGGPEEEIVDVAPEAEVTLFCQPGATTCIDASIMGTCNEEGSAFDEVSCEEEFACAEGECLPLACEPGELQNTCLTPTAYSQCNDTGTLWVPVQCPAGLTCYEGTCVDYLCPPDTILCTGMTGRQECQPDGEGSYAWVDLGECVSGLCIDGECVSACEASIKESSYLGCDYWAVDLDNVESAQYQDVAVVVSAPAGSGDAEITVTDMAANPPVELTPDELKVADDSMTVGDGELKIFMLPPGHDLDGSSLTNRSFRFQSSSPVTMHQFNPLNGANVFTNDASLLLPTAAMGSEYLVMSWPQRTSGNNLRGFVTIIGIREELTTVEVWPTSPVLAGVGVQAMSANPPVPYTFVLEQGDVLNLETNGTQGADLTGTRIVADGEVTVFGGHECANVPLGTNYCDHIEQQLFPVAAWGSTYVADAFYPRSNSQKDVWRILSGADNVVVTLTPPVATMPPAMDKGQWFEFSTGDSFLVEATGPILVGHYLQGSNYPGFGGGCFFSGIGDPAFSLGVPVEQYLNSYTFLTPQTYMEDFMNVIAPPGAEILLDGLPVAGIESDLGDWVVTQVQVADGVHTVVSDEAFGLTAYGYDCDVSYAYPGGLKLKAIQ